jgi:hypothetical protein
VSDRAKSAVGALAGIAVATAGIGVGLSAALEQGNVKGKLQAQLGLSPAEATQLGQTAGKVYANAWGDSLASVGDSVAAVKSNLGSLAGGGAANIEGLTTKAIALANTFGEEVGPLAVAAGQMVKTGLAKNSQEAFDILTVGFQNGANKSKDLLDTFNEYGTQFRKLGLDGKTATGILSQGLKGGARDADLVADSLKEFSIRAIDGSKLTAAGFKALGLDGAKMAAQIAQGGPKAAAGLDMTLDRLRAIKDPVARAAAATALFGTQSEDLGKALFALDPSTAAAAGGMGKVKGAADKVVTAVGSGPQATLQSFQRQIETSLGQSIQGVLPWATKLLAVIGPWIPTLTNIAIAAVAVAGAMKVLQIAGAGISLVTGGIRGAASAMSLFRAGLAGAQATQLAGTAGRIGNAMGLLARNIGLGTAALWGHVTAGAAAAASGIRTAAVWTAQKVALIATNVWMGIVRISTLIWTGVQWLLNAALLANPIGLIIIAIVAVVAIIVLIATKTTWFQDIWRVVWAGITTAFTATVNWLVAAGTNIGTFFTTTLPGWIKTGVAFMMAPFMAFGKWFVGMALGVGATVRGIGNWFTVTLPNMVKAGIGWVIRQITSLPGSLLTILNRIVGSVGNIGRNIVTGLWQGISNMGGWLWTQVSNFASNILNTMMHALGIRSPSTKARDQVGAQVGAGVAEGLIGSVSMVERAADAVSGAALPPAPGPGGYGAGSPAAGGGQGPVHELVLKMGLETFAKLALRAERTTGLISVAPGGGV